MRSGHLTQKGLDRMYRAMGYVHASLARSFAALRQERGQGTVEYVALILLVALVMAGVVAAMKGFKTDEGKQLGDVILGKLKQAVRRVQF
jgi:Flp pilus assembly pilin Flp